jgi:acetylornithine/succinyldiaminopimelate/putrescine aminotransferase
VLRFAPPLIVSKDEIAVCIEAFEQVLKKVKVERPQPSYL